MNKTVPGLLFLSFIATLISWGYIGHQAVGIIAENHLSPQAKEAVKILLDGRSLGEVASWADEIRDDKTFPEHFINAPLGLSRINFENEVKNQPQDNVYKAVLANEEVVKRPSATKEEKERALKFLVHFVGDLHQPMHVSRKEDQGGNTIRLKFEEKETNLHSLWDSRMIDKQGLNANEIAQNFDHATSQEAKTWQSGTLMDWLWESYQISTKLYDESLPGSKLREEYYNAHIHLVDERIEKAGIRLAGLLNGLFNEETVAGLRRVNPPPVVKSEPGSTAYAPVKLEEVSKHIDEEINVTASVAGFKELDNLLLINMGSPYPNSPLTLVFRGSAREIGEKVKATGTKFIVIGKVTEYKGKAQIEITSANQLLQPFK